MQTKTCLPTRRRKGGGRCGIGFSSYKASKGEAYDRDAIISLSPAIEELRELKSELSQVTFTYNAAGKIIVNKAPDGHSSPNRADSLMIAFAPNPGRMSFGMLDWNSGDVTWKDYA